MITKDHKLFIIVPSASMTSPVKGAAALANEAVKHVQVTFISLKEPQDKFNLLDKRVNACYLDKKNSWFTRLKIIRNLVKEAGDKNSKATISFGLSADITNLFCKDLAITCSSVRGNLPEVYPGTIGKSGKIIAFFHLKILSRLDYVVSMTKYMSRLVESYIGRPSPIIRNFIDENRLKKVSRVVKPSEPLRIVYSGLMLPNKEPQLLLSAVQALQEQGYSVRLDAYGEGPLLSKLKKIARTLPRPELIFFHGYVEEPYKEIVKAHVLVHPSKTEGTSRSVMEALFLGLPCVVRDLDQNTGLINPGINGSLFNDVNDLIFAILDAYRISNLRSYNQGSLLPIGYKQEKETLAYLNLLFTKQEFDKL